MPDKPIDLWKRHNSQPPETGPLYKRVQELPPRHKLQGFMRRMDSKTETRYASDVQLHYGGSKQGGFDAQVHFIDDDPAVYVVYKDNIDTSLTFAVAPEGIITDIDQPSNEPNPQIIERLNDVLIRLKVNHNEKVRLRKERLRKVTKRASSVIAGLIVVAGGGYVVNDKFLQPYLENRRDKEAFDNSDYNLPDVGALQNEFGIISESDMQEIPEYNGNDDDLKRPRQFSIESDDNDGCYASDISLDPKDTLYASVTEGSELANQPYTYTISKYELVFCVGNGETLNGDVAIQVR